MKSVCKFPWSVVTQSGRWPPPNPSPTPLSSSADLEAIAQNLGIADASELKSEVFPVGQKKLNRMIKRSGDINGVSCAEEFFENIHELTNTCIGWPCDINNTNLQSYIRVIGRPDDSTWARGLIQGHIPPMSLMLKINTVVLGSDIPEIKTSYEKIMEQTGMHVQINEKKNEVEMYGHLENLSQAVEMLFLSSPLSISFELPSKLDRAQLNMLQDELILDVRVHISTTSTPNKYLFHVMATEQEADMLKDAVHSVTEYICNPKPTRILVTIHLKMCRILTKIYHMENSSFVPDVEKKTKTKIKLISTKNPTLMSITGTIDAVYKAKRMLKQVLPIKVIFDIPDNPELISKILDSPLPNRIRISIKRHEEDNIAVVTLKGSRSIIIRLNDALQKIVDVTNNSAFKIPAYRQTMKNTINRYHSSNEGDPFAIWVPTDPNIVNNFLHVSRKQDQKAEDCRTPADSDKETWEASRGDLSPCSEERNKSPCEEMPSCSNKRNKVSSVEGSPHSDEGYKTSCAEQSPCSNEHYKASSGGRSPCSDECCKTAYEDTSPCSKECCKPPGEEIPTCSNVYYKAPSEERSPRSTYNPKGPYLNCEPFLSAAERRQVEREGFSAEDIEVALILSTEFPLMANGW